MSLKDQSRILGIDDGPYVRGSSTTPIVMTVWRLDGYIDGILMARIETDGDDSARVISETLRRSRFAEQVRFIISDGACLAGFNALDLDDLNRRTSIPVMTSSDEPPNTDSVISALTSSGLPKEERLRIITAHTPFFVDTPDGIIFVRFSGTTELVASEVIRKATIRGRVPEPVRISHIIAKAMYSGGVL